MRLANDVVYYWPPTCKDEEFEPVRMECWNLKWMLDTSPYRKTDNYGHARPRLVEGNEDRCEAIVRVVCFPGLVAYRKGGGELGKRLLAEEGVSRKNANTPRDVQIAQARTGQSITHASGFRTRVVSKAVVYLTWGKQRLLTKEAGTAAHLDAMRNGDENKYIRDREGFKELYELYLDRLQERMNEPTRHGPRMGSREPLGKGQPSSVRKK